jgi:UDP-3-O-[3-hydroxymyristoyl] N-acetylglucosamine deacetylase
MRYQRTISKAVGCSGVGLHSGKKVDLRLMPAPVNTGIVFIRTDSNHGRSARVSASINKVAATSLSTILKEDSTMVHTVEHLLSALSGMQVDNLYAEINSAELPIMDGSASPFVDMLLKAGIVEQSKPQPQIKILEPIGIEEDGKQVMIMPASNYRISYSIDFDHPAIAKQSYHYDSGPAYFQQEIAAARTFGFLKEVEALWAQGYARGGSMDNAVIIGDEGILNKEGLRFPDEFVRHKILDLIGDLSLLGMPVIGHLVAVRSGHALHTKLAAKILEEKHKWTVVGTEEPEAAYPAPEPTKWAAPISVIWGQPQAA